MIDSATNARQIVFVQRKRLPVKSKEQFQPLRPDEQHRWKLFFTVKS